ncbi:MAG: FimV/HubP family polar landmark protein [Pseudomonadota bacterium]
MAKILRGLAGLAAVLASSSVFALGLGEIEIRSRLNQPLSASISITSTSLAELNSASVRLASNEDFERAGIDRTDFLSSLEFEIKGDQLYVSSRQPAREPFVSFLVEVRWSGGRLLREYTVLLDPPGLTQAKKPATEKITVADEADEPAATDPSTLPAAKTRRTEAPSAAAQTYGPVERKETLWGIASQLRPNSDITMDQMMWAIYQANRAAFDGGIKGLRSGVTLKVPGEEEILATSAADAKAKVQGVRARPVRKPEPPKKTEVVEPKAESVPAPAPEAKPEPKIEQPVEAPKPVAVAPAPTPVPAAAPAAAPVAPATAAPPAPAPAAVPAPTPVPAASAPATTPATAPASKAMVDEEPAATATPAPTPAQTSPAAPVAADASVAPAPVVSAPPAAAPPPPIIAEPAPGEVPEASLLDNPLLLPATAGIVLLGAVAAFFVFWKRRRASVKVEPAAPVSSTAKFDPSAAAANLTPKSAPAFVPAPAPVPAMAAVKSAREKLEEDTRTTDSAISSTVAMESTLASTQAREAAQTLSQTVAQEPGMARTAGGTPRKVDFDVTAQFAAETVQINLDANDPLAEADFHLAYGLYDEAALLLKQAADKNPERVELRTKLAEVYFAAGKAEDFRKTAENLKNRLPAAQWSKVAIMGQQLCPDAPIFKDAGAAAIADDIDLAFDDAPAAAPAPPAAAPPVARKETETLEFNLDDFQMPTSAAEPVAPKTADAGNSLQFDLGDLKLETAPVATLSKAEDIKLEDMNLDQFDTPAADASPTMVAESSATLAEPSLDMPTGGDEVATKLDLARAYMDMGDTDMAKSLLGEVQQQGNAQQKSEAQGLLGRLGS